MSYTIRICPFAIGVVAVALCSAQIPAARAQEDRKPDAPAPAKVVRKPLGALEKEATERVEPVYPPLARAAKLTGVVVVEVTVDEAGSVAAAQAVSGHALLKDAAVEAARKWKFKLSGASVQMIGLIILKFTIDGAQKADRVNK